MLHYWAIIGKTMFAKDETSLSVGHKNLTILKLLALNKTGQSKYKKPHKEQIMQKKLINSCLSFTVVSLIRTLSRLNGMTFKIAVKRGLGG